MSYADDFITVTGRIGIYQATWTYIRRKDHIRLRLWPRPTPNKVWSAQEQQQIRDGEEQLRQKVKLHFANKQLKDYLDKQCTPVSSES